MGSLKSNDPFHAYQLLPPAYQNHRWITKAIFAWIAVACTLLALLGVVIAVTAIEAKRDHQARQRLAAAAAPLLDLRRESLRLSESNPRRRQWCEWVESARPDDNAFQTLAAIATSSQSDGSNIKIDRIDVKLPLEYPATEAAPPPWAAAHLQITGRVSSPALATRWIDRLNNSDRVSDAGLDDEPTELSGGRVEITATPITTRVLP